MADENVDTKSEETAELETKVEETEEKLADAKANPEYATKDDISSLTAMLAEFRTELAESKKTPEKSAEKPKVPAPEKKPEAKKPEVKPEPKTEAKEEVKETGYGSRRWFGGR